MNDDIVLIATIFNTESFGTRMIGLYRVPNYDGYYYTLCDYESEVTYSGNYDYMLSLLSDYI